LVGWWAGEGALDRSKMSGRRDIWKGIVEIRREEFVMCHIRKWTAGWN